MVDGSDSWQETWNRDECKFENLGFHQAETQKYRKHEAPNIRVGPQLGIVSSGLLGPALLISVRLLSDICGLLLGWNSVSMPFPAVSKVSIRWMILPVLNFMPVVFAIVLRCVCVLSASPAMLVF